MGQAGPSLGIASTESHTKRKGKRLQVARCAARRRRWSQSHFQHTEYLSHKAKDCFLYRCTMKEQCLPKVLVMEVVFLKLEKGTSVDKMEGHPNRQRVL